MDPVCCMTCYPQLLSSFIYKGYTFQEAMGSLLGLAHAVRFIFSRDLIIAEASSGIVCILVSFSILGAANQTGLQEV